MVSVVSAPNFLWRELKNIACSSSLPDLLTPSTRRRNRTGRNASRNNNNNMSGSRTSFHKTNDFATTGSRKKQPSIEPTYFEKWKFPSGMFPAAVRCPDMLQRYVNDKENTTYYVYKGGKVFASWQRKKLKKCNHSRPRYENWTSNIWMVFSRTCSFPLIKFVTNRNWKSSLLPMLSFTFHCITGDDPKKWGKGILGLWNIIVADCCWPS